MGIYRNLTDLLPLLDGNEYGDWITDRVHDGTPESPIQMPFVNYSITVRKLETAVYQFMEEHPEYELNHYGEILEANGIKWDSQEMKERNVADLDGKCVMALLMGAIRAERFSDGALLDFLQSGSIKKWLERLQQFEVRWLFTLSDFLRQKGLLYDGTIDEKVRARQGGKSFSFSEHLKAMIYAMLSGQRTWGELVPHLPEIDALFYNYDADKILAHPYTYFVDCIQKIKCGNRRIKLQMQQLPDNIGTFRAIEKKYGSLDAYVTSAPAYQIVDELATGKYKLHNMREALCWEYLRNVGIDGAKPDTHLRRFLGSNRMGAGNHPIATIPEVNLTTQRLSQASGLSMAAIDNIIWSFCSDGYGEICVATPKCGMCLISDCCANGEKGLTAPNRS